MHTLNARIQGTIVLPHDPDFAAAVAGFNTAIVHRPDVVVRAASEADVVEAVRFATEAGLPVRVHSTGHGANLPVTDGMLLSTGALDRVSIDPAARTATIGAGARWGAVVAAAAEHGLAPSAGSSLNVGVVGYLLGGGLGPLARSHGASSDRLRSVRLVTADGSIVTASAVENPELFWALRGGKGGFGVVTEVEIELLELPDLYAGSMFFDTEHVERVLRGWIDWTASAPDEVTTSVLLVNFPDVEFIPAPLRGRFLINVRFAAPVDATTGERLAAPLRALAPVDIDALGPMRLADIAAIHNDPSDPGPGWGIGGLLRELDDDFATALLGQFAPGVPSPFLGVELRHLGGAFARDVDGGSAVGGRDAAFAFHVIGAPVPELFAEVLPAAGVRFSDAIRDWLSPTTTINFSGPIVTPEQHEAAWPGELGRRLAAVRQAVDPARRFPYGPAV